MTASEAKLDKQNVEDIIALTPMQEGMLLHYLKDPAGDSYFEQLSLEIEAVFDVSLVEKAWNRLIETNEVLRTVYRWEGVKNPVQIILKSHVIHLVFHDLSATAHQEQSLEQLKLADRKKKFTLLEVPFRITVCQLSASRWVMMISNHHILYDGWSTGIILKEFFQTYAGLTANQYPPVPLKSSFKEFIRWQQKQDKHREAAFWQTYLEDYQPVKIPGFTLPEEDPSPSAVRNISFRLPTQLTQALEQWARKQKVTQSSLFYTAWGIVLQRYCNTDDVVFGTTISGRTPQVPHIENAVGLFINTLPLRCKTSATQPIGELVQEIHQALQVRDEYQSTSLANVSQYTANKEALFESIVVIENYPLAEAITTTEGIRLKAYEAFEQTPYHLTLSITAFSDVEVSIAYQDSLYSTYQVEGMAKHFENVLAEISHKVNEPVRDIEMVSAGERARTVDAFNRTEADYPRHLTIQALFEKQALARPDQTAVVHQGQSITYQTLNEKANQLAVLLRANGALPDTLIAVLTERSVEMVISILAVLKSGAAYVPIDPNTPATRLQYLLEDSQVRLIITQKKLLAKVGETPLPLQPLLVDELPSGNPAQENLSPVNTASHLAYLMYTSGTTGRPKGVMIEHRNVTNYITWFGRTIPMRENLRYLMLIDYIFDPSIADLFGTLLHGATLYIADKDLIYDKDRFAAYIAEHSIHVIDSVPAILKEVLVQLPKLPSLHTVLVGSEALDNGLKDQIVQNGYTLFNHYGLTETTVDVSIQKCSQEPVTIGKPIANVTCYVLDTQRRMVPVGVPGELFVGGAGVGRGYLQQPGLNAEKFLTDPYTSGRMYRTGDLVRWLPDGNLAFLGRVDHQLNVRGFRVEPAEIQKVLEQLPGIREAVIIGKVDKNQQAYLVACYVPDAGTTTVPAIRHYAAQQLPAYMVPSVFISVEQIPRTAAGKIDQKALALLADTHSEEQRTYVAPQTDLEKTIAGIWKELLQVGKVGLHENFFDIGGNSLYIIRLNSRIKAVIKQDIPVTAFFEYPTIHAFVAFLIQPAEALVEESDLENRLSRNQEKLKQRRELLKSRI